MKYLTLCLSVDMFSNVMVYNYNNYCVVVSWMFSGASKYSLYNYNVTKSYPKSQITIQKCKTQNQGCMTLHGNHKLIIHNYIT